MRSCSDFLLVAAQQPDSKLVDFSDGTEREIVVPFAWIHHSSNIYIYVTTVPATGLLYNTVYPVSLLFCVLCAQVIPASMGHGNRCQVIPACMGHGNRCQVIPASMGHGNRCQVISPCMGHGNCCQVIPACMGHDYRCQVIPACMGHCNCCQAFGRLGKEVWILVSSVTGIKMLQLLCFCGPVSVWCIVVNTHTHACTQTPTHTHTQSCKMHTATWANSDTCTLLNNHLIG